MLLVVDREGVTRTPLRKGDLCMKMGEAAGCWPWTQQVYNAGES